MSKRTTLRRAAQLTVVLLCALTLKLYYSSASPNQLRWILAPTTKLVELITDTRFVFESHEGYVNSGRTFVIAASCAGVNFLITSFLMLSLRSLWRTRSQNLGWRFIPFSMLFAYVATIVANTVRISIALWLQHVDLGISWLNPNQIHRFEGIFVYFAFLLLLFVTSELVYEKQTKLFRLTLFPLALYYATTLGLPLMNGAYRQGTSFWEHSLFVLLIPLPLILLLVLIRKAADRFEAQRRLQSLRLGRRFTPAC
jgi:exosortase K